ncbi:MAG: AmmeMemoRadiSam system protein B [Planctomycetota bacterium]|jgi:AmmeMemoRadiSam system protein B
MTIREPSVAGLFYPADPAELQELVGALLATVPAATAGTPKALIVPHAGYPYSGPVAASGYRQVGRTTTRVVLLGPAHRLPFRGLAAHSADAFATPLGDVPLDRDLIARLCELDCVRELDQAHVGEHSLEVHLPFLQVVLGDFQLVPLVVGDATPEHVAEALELAWGGDETLVVVSSDLSHFHEYDEAGRIDAETVQLIKRLEHVHPGQACGCRAIGGLQEVARRRGLELELLDLRNSGDTAGGKREVVGYAAFAAR